jgi:nucleoid DNA-binding protein
MATSKADVLIWTDLVKAISLKTGYRRADVDRVLKTMNSLVISSLHQGNSVRMGLVNLRVVDIPEKDFFNPRTGTKVHKLAHRAIRVRLSAQLRHWEEDTSK